MATSGITASYEALPQILKVILQIFFGGIIGGVYRIIRFVETQNIVTLIAGLLCIPFGFVGWIVDFVTELLSNKITVLAD